jgi:hypothetical protein
MRTVDSNGSRMDLLRGRDLSKFEGTQAGHEVSTSESSASRETTGLERTRVPRTDENRARTRSDDFSSHLEGAHRERRDDPAHTMREPHERRAPGPRDAHGPKDHEARLETRHAKATDKTAREESDGAEGDEADPEASEPRVAAEALALLLLAPPPLPEVTLAPEGLSPAGQASTKSPDAKASGSGLAAPAEAPQKESAKYAQSAETAAKPDADTAQVLDALRADDAQGTDQAADTASALKLAHIKLAKPEAFTLELAPLAANLDLESTEAEPELAPEKLDFQTIRLDTIRHLDPQAPVQSSRPIGEQLTDAVQKLLAEQAGDSDVVRFRTDDGHTFGATLRHDGARMELRLTAEDPATRALLGDRLPEVRSALERAGLSAQVSVDRDGRSRHRPPDDEPPAVSPLKRRPTEFVETSGLHLIL